MGRCVTAARGCFGIIGAGVLLLLVGCQKEEPTHSVSPAAVAEAKPPARAPAVPERLVSAETVKPDPSVSAVPAVPAASDTPAIAAVAAVEKPAAGTAEKPAEASTEKPTETKWPPLMSGPSAEEIAAEQHKPLDLGPPLVDHPEQLIRLDPQAPVYVDKEHKQLVIMGRICQRAVPLELFACLRDTKEHEAVVSIDSKALVIHAGLLAVGAEPGSPARFQPKFTPATGQEIEIEVRWKEGGQVRKMSARDMVRNINTKKAMTEKWVFAGSAFWVNPSTGERHYMAEGGDLFCLSNFSGATLDVNIESTSANDDLLYEAFTEHIPELNTPVTLVLTPKTK